MFTHMFLFYINLKPSVFYYVLFPSLRLIFVTVFAFYSKYFYCISVVLYNSCCAKVTFLFDRLFCVITLNSRKPTDQRKDRWWATQFARLKVCFVQVLPLYQFGQAFHCGFYRRIIRSRVRGAVVLTPPCVEFTIKAASNKRCVVAGLCPLSLIATFVYSL